MALQKASASWGVVGFAKFDLLLVIRTTAAWMPLFHPNGSSPLTVLLRIPSESSWRSESIRNADMRTLTSNSSTVVNIEQVGC